MKKYTEKTLPIRKAPHDMEVVRIARSIVSFGKTMVWTSQTSNELSIKAAQLEKLAAELREIALKNLVQHAM